MWSRFRTRLLALSLLLATLHSGQFPICNPNLDWHTRAVDLVSRFTVTEKIGWIGDASPAIPRLGIPFYEWESEALHGIAGSYGGVNFTNGPVTCASQFPEPILMSAAFSRDLINEVATAISTEARAMNNVGQAGMTFFTPNINLYRDPRWGRGQETPGEDPYLASEYVYALITGLQGGVDDRYLKVVADCKHFAAYDLENWDNVTRFEFNAIVSDQDLQESLLPAFESCIRDAHVGSIMCSYNALNGVPACGNSFLLQDLARDAWGLEGFVVSDCDAVAVIQNPHFYTKTNDDTVALALHAGTDINCGDYYQTNALSALENEAINETDIDQALVRSIGTLIRTGWFDPPEIQPYRQVPVSAVNSAEHQALALRAAVEGIVLLKNEPSPLGTFLTLPWSPKDNPTIALIGPMNNATDVMKGNYYGIPPYLISPIQGLTEAGFKINAVQGCAVNGSDESGFPAALAAAQAADYVMYIGGIDQDFEAEQLDRYSIDLPLIQQKMIAALAESLTGSNAKPFVTAFFGGGPVDYSVAKQTPEVGAILWLGYPGQSGGAALAQIITGLASPAGRLVTTIYPADYVNQVSLFDMSFRVSATNPGRTYKFYPEAQAIYPFGTGLSYTTFQLDWIEEGVESKALKRGAAQSSMDEETGLPLHTLSIRSLHAAHVAHHRGTAVSYRVNVTNTGEVVSDTSVLLFVLPATPDPSLPFKELIGFDRVSALAPGNTTEVFFPVQARQLARVNAKGERWIHPGRVHLGVDVPTRRVAVLELTGLAMRLH